jgi:hypothetical protein
VGLTLVSLFMHVHSSFPKSTGEAPDPSDSLPRPGGVEPGHSFYVLGFGYALVPLKVLVR